MSALEPVAASCYRHFMTLLDARLPPRFWSKVRVDDAGCWRWVAAHDEFGYARFGWLGHNRHAHRVCYERLVGPVPPGLELDHLCRVRDCVNPSHMEAVTHHVNMVRSLAPTIVTMHAGVCLRGHAYVPGAPCRECARLNEAAFRRRRGVRTREQRKADALARGCAHGHDWTPENTYVYRGWRHCRACARMKRAKARSREDVS